MKAKEAQKNEKKKARTEMKEIMKIAKEHHIVPLDKVPGKADTYFKVIKDPNDFFKTIKTHDHTDKGFFCKLCSQEIWNDKGDMEVHIGAKKHKKNYEWTKDDGYNHLRILPDIKAPLTLEYRKYIHKEVSRSDGAVQFKCALCKFKLAYPEHLTSADHQKKLENYASEIQCGEYRQDRDDSDDEEDDAAYYCSDSDDYENGNRGANAENYATYGNDTNQGSASPSFSPPSRGRANGTPAHMNSVNNSGGHPDEGKEGAVTGTFWEGLKGLLHVVDKDKTDMSQIGAKVTFFLKLECQCLEKVPATWGGPGEYSEMQCTLCSKPAYEEHMESAKHKKQAVK